MVGLIEGGAGFFGPSAATTPLFHGASTMLAVVTRAREAAPIPARSEADRPAPAGCAVLRLLADVDISFSRNCCLAASGADDGARAIGADADVGFAWSGRKRWCRRRSSAASYRVIGNDRKFRSTDRVSAVCALWNFGLAGWCLYPLARGCRAPRRMTPELAATAPAIPVWRYRLVAGAAELGGSVADRGACNDAVRGIRRVCFWNFGLAGWCLYPLARGCRAPRRMTQ